MAESTTTNSKFESIREWVVQHKLRTVGSLWASGVIGSLAYNWSQPGKTSVKIIHASLWASGVIGSLAYNWSQPGKTSVKIIHARLHAQALTLAALAGAAVVEYYDHKAGKNADPHAKFLPLNTYSQKD